LRELHPELEEFHMRLGKDRESLVIVSRKKWLSDGHPE